MIRTDKIEYQPGENIKITVTNNSTESICYDSQKECGLPFWSLSKYEENCSRENCWPEVRQVPPCLWETFEDKPEPKQLKIGEKIEEIWNQTIYSVKPSILIESPLKLVGPGKYRFDFEYWPLSHCTNCESCKPLGRTPISRSNEFEITEKVSQVGFDLSSPEALAKAFIEVSNNKDFTGFKSLHHPKLREYLEKNSPYFLEMTFKPILIRENSIPDSAKIRTISDFEQTSPEYWYYYVMPTHKFTIQWTVGEPKEESDFIFEIKCDERGNCKTVKTPKEPKDATYHSDAIEKKIAKFEDKWYLVLGIPRYLMKKEAEECSDDYECQTINCSKYDTPEKQGYKPDCVDGKCKCMCYGCD